MSASEAVWIGAWVGVGYALGSGFVEWAIDTWRRSS